jgi:hypothetical protein
MTKKTVDAFAAKHGQDSKRGVDPVIRAKLEKKTREGTLSCAAAFTLAADLDTSPADIGKAADLLGTRLVKCQLGLFGYTPEKKIVKPAATVDPLLQEAIRGELQGGRLPCRNAWDLAERFRLSRMAVSAACETLGIKVKPCQLGAF